MGRFRITAIFTFFSCAFCKDDGEQDCCLSKGEEDYRLGASIFASLFGF